MVCGCIATECEEAQVVLTLPLLSRSLEKDDTLDTENWERERKRFNYCFVSDYWRSGVTSSIRSVDGIPLWFGCYIYPRHCRAATSTPHLVKTSAGPSKYLTARNGITPRRDAVDTFNLPNDAGDILSRTRHTKRVWKDEAAVLLFSSTINRLSHCFDTTTCSLQKPEAWVSAYKSS